MVAGPSKAIFGHLVGGDRRRSIFAEWNAGPGSLRLDVDQHGVWPLYYATGAGFAAASPSVLTLLDNGADRGLDLDALSVFIRLGFFLGEDTAFKSVRALPPGGSVCWSSASGLSVQPAPRPVQHANISRDAAIDAYIELFRKAIERRLPDAPFIMPLSGGRDSRHILLELHRQKKVPELCVTTSLYGNRTDQDIRVAPMIAAAVGASWKSLNPWILEVRAEVHKNRITGFCSDEHGWALGLSDYFAHHDVQTIFDGLAGDTLAGLQYQTEKMLALQRAHRFEDVAEEIFSSCGLSEAWLQSVLRPELYRRLSRDRAVSRLVAELKRFADHATPIAAFFFWNRMRREVALYTCRIIPASVYALCPYLDQNLVNFMLSLPGEHTLDKRFHDDCITRAFPEFANIPFEDKTAKSTGRGIYWRFLSASYALYTLGGLGASRLVNHLATVPRLFRGAITGETGKARLLTGRGQWMLLYLTQLERVI